MILTVCIFESQCFLFLRSKALNQHVASIVVTDSKAYASRMNKKAKSLSRILEGHMRLIALLMYIADQKKKSVAATEQLFRRLMLPRKD